MGTGGNHVSFRHAVTKSQPIVEVNKLRSGACMWHDVSSCSRLRAGDDEALAGSLFKNRSSGRVQRERSAGAGRLARRAWPIGRKAGGTCIARVPYL